MATLAKVLRRLGKMNDPLPCRILYRSNLPSTSLSHSQRRMLSNSTSTETANVSGSMEGRSESAQVAADVQEDDFSTMLRRSKLFQLGHYQGKTVEGVIQKVVGEDLYIDFGGKFFCVSQKPQTKNPRKFIRGQKVRICLQELELSTRFLGATKDLTLCEADGLLVGSVTNKTDKTQL